MKFSKVFISALCFILICFAHISAMAEKDSNYTIVKAGIYNPTGNLNDNFNFDVGFNGEIVLGHYFSQNIAAEIGIGYFRTRTEATNSRIAFVSSFGTISYKEEGDIKVYPVTLTTKFLFPIENFELFGLAGVGLYYTKVNYDLQTNLGNFSDDDKDTVFGFHIGAGSNLYVTNEIFVGVEGKYLFTNEGEVSLFGVPFKSDLNGFTVNVNIGSRF